MSVSLEQIVRHEDHIIDQYTPRFAQLQERWDEALGVICSLLKSDTVKSLEASSGENWYETRKNLPDRPVIIGIAGPGASGKGTLSEVLVENLGYERVVNTTTRPPRDYERNGHDYYFMEASDFATRLATDAFLVSMERAGRGSYGISREEVADKLSRGNTGCIIEENPRNLLTALDIAHRTNPESLSVLLYILPPDPIVETSARRLYGRSSLDPTTRQLTSNDIESTLGDRQIDEFLDVQLGATANDVSIVFLVNDDLEVSKKKLAHLFGARQS